MWESLGAALATVLSFEHLVHLSFGVIIGLAVGVFPGLGGIAGLSLLLPFIYGMELTSALATLIGLVAVIPTSDTFTSVLMGIPGSSASQATVLDGFPLAKQGQAARALSAAFTASLFGGLIGALLLTLFVQIARPVLLIFGSAELFMLAVLGLSMVGALSGRSAWKGVAACGVGLVAGSVGPSPATGEFRMVFGIEYLYDGLPLVVVALGIFAIPEIVDLLRKDRAISESGVLGAGWLEGVKDVWRNKFLCVRSAGLGALIGAIPGMGGSVVDWIAYGHVVQSSKDKSMFGKGDIRGVIAPESANNAKEGGALMPTLLFGIPGSGSMAVFLGGLVLLGVEAGPSMVTSDIDLTYTIIWSLALANVLGAGLCLLLAAPIARLTTVPFALLAPFMIAVISFAAFQATRQVMDLWMLFACGILGVLFRRYGWSRPAFLIGFVLAPQAETYLIMAVQFYGWEMFLRPGVLIIGALAAVSIRLSRRGAVDEHGSDGAAANTGPLLAQQLAAGGALALFLVAVDEGSKQSFLGGVFLIAIAAALVPIAAYLLWVLMTGRRENPIVFDAEIRSAGEYKTGALRPLMWMGGLYAGTVVVGFIPAIAAFFLGLLRNQGTRWPLTLSLTAGGLSFLLAMGHLLVLEFPGGLLTEALEIRWP